VTTTFRRLLGSAAIVVPLVAAAAGARVAAGDGATLAVATPDGFVSVTDDTGTMSVAVPDGWDVATDPIVEGETEFVQPVIRVSGTGVAGTDVTALFYADRYEPTVTAEDGCDDPQLPCDTVLVSELFAVGEFTGFRVTLEPGFETARRQVIDANPANQLFTARMVFLYDNDGDLATFDQMLETFHSTGTPLPTERDDAAGPAPFVPVFPYATFGEVPQLGTEPVRGTGCGADGSIGDVIPDGIWAGFVDAPAPDESLSVDLLCIFTPEAAPGIIAGGTATVLIPNAGTAPDPSYLVVNNNERERTVPAAAGLELRDAIVDGDQCIEGPLLPDVDHLGYQAWINIEGGVATWVIWGCDWFGTGDSPTPTPAPDPAPAPAPTAPAPAANTEEALIQADCALLQNTIWEGDAFLGVDYPADGEPFTDSLRQAIEYTRDMLSSEASQVQSQLAQTAFAQYYAEWDSLLQAGIYTSTNIGAVTEAGQYALAPLQNACGWAE
jgi:hypothetical protein